MDSDREHLTPAASWLARTYYTPLSDALRGDFSGRLDIRHQLAASGLPAEVCVLIRRVARRSRLWRSEQIDVTSELIAHFADGRDAGRSAEELIASFGSIEQAARLIRRGKLRLRPRYWQVWWWVSRSLMAGLAVGMLVYAWLTIRFFWGAPNVARNYWQEINAARAVPQPDRAWPVYRQALAQIGNADSQLIGENWQAKFDEPVWTDVTQALQRQAAAIALIRQGSSLPALGYLYGDPEDRAFAKQHHVEWALRETAPLADENQMLISAILDGMPALRQLAYVLAADTRRAAAAGDGATTFANIVAQLGMAEQTFQPKSVLVEQLVGVALFQLACDTLGLILHEHPDQFTEPQLRDLAHHFAAFRRRDFRLDFAGEMAMFDDIMQRAYTDDGDGDGRLTAAGIKVLQRAGNAAPADDERAIGLLVNAASPGFSAIVASRKENTNLYRSIIEEGQAVRSGPPWTWNPDELKAVDERLDKLRWAPITKLRYAWVFLLAPAVGGCETATQQMIQKRDAVEVALALTLWHRRHNAWPQQLDQLTPDLLPTVPPDRRDGKPLRFVVRDGQPVLYSVGDDGVDDGGVPGPTTNHFQYGRDSTGRSTAPRSLPEDWVLWPPPIPQNGLEGIVEEPREPIMAPPGGPSEEALNDTP